MAASPHFIFSKLPTPTAGQRWLLLAALATLSTQCQPSTPAEQPAAQATSPGSLKLEDAVATPIPKFDVESPILRQLALLPPAERNAAPEAMHHYQQLTRRFWLAQYASAYLVKEAQTGQPNPPLFASQLATTQRHWRVLRAGFKQAGALPPTMTAHFQLMQQVADYQQAALSDLQADCDAERAPHLDAATATSQQQVQKLLAPLQRDPGPLKVHIR
jgi:hypothetical protein